MKEYEKKAYEFAKKAHQGQLDDSGEDYFQTHILQVVNILRQVTTDPTIRQAGYLHDIYEDTQYTYDFLKKEFGVEVADLVNEVTHEGSSGKGYYFPRLHSKKGIILKFADRLSNLTRMDCWGETRQTHYLMKSKFWKSERS